MYQVTSEFKEAMKSSFIMPCLRGEIDGVAYSENDIIKDSFRICNQCVDSSKINVGGVYIGELQMTLYSSIANKRGNWIDKKVTCEYGLNVNGSEQYIPTPSYEYTIKEALWTAEGLEITAYDNMSKLDKEYSGAQSSGYLYDWLAYIAKECKVRLGQTREEIEAFPNGQVVLGLYSQDVIQTYRDLLHYLSSVAASFATCDRSGAIVLKTFKKDIDDSNEETKRFAGGSFSDYVTKYTAISYYDVELDSVIKKGRTKESELTIELGKNPFIQYGTKIIKDQMLTSILNSIEAFEYTPFNTTLLGCCAYDLGDVINFTGGIAQGSIGCIMMYDFGLNDYSIAGYGDNPSIQSSTSLINKSISGVSKSQKSGEFGVASVTNIKEVAIDSAWRTIGRLAFVVGKSETCLFHAVAKMNLRISGSVQFKYVVNGTELDFIHEVQCPYGIDTATLFIPFLSNHDANNNFEVKVRSENAVGTIEALDMNGAIIGAGITANEWDGVIELEDELGRITIYAAKIPGMSEEVSLSMQIPIRVTVEDILNRINEVGMNIKGINERISITMKIGEYPIMTEDGEYILTEDGDTIYSKGGFIDG